MAKSEDSCRPAQSQKTGTPSPPTENAAPVSFDELSGGRKEVQIEHRGQVYRLRATRNGGLILNK